MSLAAYRATESSASVDALQRHITDLEQSLGDRRPVIWIPGSTTNTWAPVEGEQIEDAARPLTAPARILTDGTRVPSRGRYETDRSTYGGMRTGPLTLHVLGPTAQIARTCTTCNGTGIQARGSGKWNAEWRRCGATGCTVEEGEARLLLQALMAAVNPSGRMA